MNILEDPKIQEMIIRKKLSESRQKVYRTVLSSIYELTGKSPTELIQEAKKEEKPYIENNQAVFIDIDDRKVKKHIYQYYNYLENKNISPASIDSYLKTLRSFYSEYNIELPKNIQIETITELIQEDEIITKEKIRLALETTDNFRNKAIILLMASSGIRSGDIRNFKISDFLKATKDYHDGSIETLFESKEDIIPTWYFIPKKTRKKGNICVTFNTPETSKYIIQYLKKRNNLTPEDYLFEAKGKKMGKWGLIELFRKINEKNFGRTKKGKRYFKAHSLRKFFITKCSHNSGDLRKIALLSGHAPPIKTDKNYVSINFEVMKEFYSKLIPQLSIQDTEIKTIKSKEFLKIEKELKGKEERMIELERNMEEKEIEMQKIRTELKSISQLVTLQDRYDKFMEKYENEGISIPIEALERGESYLPIEEFENEEMSILVKELERGEIGLSFAELEGLKEIINVEILSKLNDLSANSRTSEMTKEEIEEFKEKMFRIVNNPEYQKAVKKG